MASIKLYESQIAYLRSKAGINTLMTALLRYENGELVTENTDFQKKDEKLLPYSLHKKLSQDPKLVRAVIFAQMRNGVDLTGEIVAVGDEITEWFNSLNVPYLEA